MLLPNSTLLRSRGILHIRAIHSRRLAVPHLLEHLPQLLPQLLLLHGLLHLDDSMGRGTRYRTSDILIASSCLRSIVAVLPNSHIR